MIIEELGLKNYWSYKNEFITFDKNVYMILGQIINSNKSNGSGKSTIARAIFYALHGDSNNDDRTTKVKNDNMIYNDENIMEVYLAMP